MSLTSLPRIKKIGLTKRGEAVFEVHLEDFIVVTQSELEDPVRFHEAVEAQLGPPTPQDQALSYLYAHGVEFACATQTQVNKVIRAMARKRAA